MSRIRTIKPDFWSSTQIVSCSIEARLLFIGLWNFCDDRGIHTKDYKRIKMEVFPADPFTEKNIVKWVEELINNKLVEEYKLDGQSYFKVCNWEKHQKINRPTYRHPYTFSPKNEQNSVRTHGGLMEDSVRTHGGFSEDSWSAQCRKGVVNKETVVNTNPKISDKDNINYNIQENILKKRDNIYNKKNARPSNSSEPGFYVLDGEIVESDACREENAIQTRSKSRQEGLKSSILEVFREWSVSLDMDSKINAQREKIIREALRDNSVEKLKKAIIGCTRTPWYMEQNLTQLKHIFKDQDTIDMFVRNADKPPKIPIDPNNKYAMRSRAFDLALDHNKDLQKRLDARAEQLREREIEEARKKKEELDASVFGQVARIE